MCFRSYGFYQTQKSVSNGATLTALNEKLSRGLHSILTLRQKNFQLQLTCAIGACWAPMDLRMNIDHPLSPLQEAVNSASWLFLGPVKALCNKNPHTRNGGRPVDPTHTISHQHIIYLRHFCFCWNFCYKNTQKLPNHTNMWPYLEQTQSQQRNNWEHVCAWCDASNSQQYHALLAMMFWTKTSQNWSVNISGMFVEKPPFRMKTAMPRRYNPGWSKHARVSCHFQV